MIQGDWETLSKIDFLLDFSNYRKQKTMPQPAIILLFAQ